MVLTRNFASQELPLTVATREIDESSTIREAVKDVNRLGEQCKLR